MDDHPGRLVARLRADIEALADATVESDTAYTKAGAQHLTIVNGFIKAEGARASAIAALSVMCGDSLNRARELRTWVNGPARLSWRLPPSLEGRFLRMRLAFEPLAGH